MDTKNNINNEIVKTSFYISYAFMFTTTAICFIEALRTNDEKIRHIMNIETCISLIAAFFYGKFIEMIKDGEIDYEKINLIRYADWFLSTPVMLLGLGLVLCYNLNIPFKFRNFLIILLLNFGMLLFGFLGEIKKIDKKYALIGGFILFAFLFYYIYSLYVKDRKIMLNTVTFLVFIIIWSMYGIAYMANPKIKNITFNILDTLAKCIVGIGFWAYFVKLFK